MLTWELRTGCHNNHRQGQATNPIPNLVFEAHRRQIIEVQLPCGVRFDQEDHKIFNVQEIPCQKRFLISRPVHCIASMINYYYNLRKLARHTCARAHTHTYKIMILIKSLLFFRTIKPLIYINVKYVWSYEDVFTYMYVRHKYFIIEK